MIHELIRFSCSCGKRLAAPAKKAGRDTTCPNCRKPVRVPDPAAAPPPAPRKQEPPARADHPRLDAYYRALVDRFGDRIERHGVEDGCPVLRLRLPVHRGQEVRLRVGKDGKGREILSAVSEIGTVSTFEETTEALRINRRIAKGNLYLDESNVLVLEYRLRLSETDEAQVIRAFEELAERADEIELRLFGVDIR